MANHNGIASLRGWTVMLICMFSMTFQVSKEASCIWSSCRAASSVEVAPGKGEKVVNLIVTCERDVAHLNFSTSGLKVSSIRLAQHCRVLGEYDSSDCEPSQILSHSISQQEGWKPGVSPSNQHLLEFGLECHYFGCYRSDPDDGQYFYTFPTATCTFAAQSSVYTFPTAAYTLTEQSSLYTLPTAAYTSAAQSGIYALPTAAYTSAAQSSVYTLPTASALQSSIQLLPTATSAESSTLTKPTTYTPQILNSIVLNYPSETNANSTGQHTGSHQLLPVIITGVMMTALVPIPLCLF